MTTYSRVYSIDSSPSGDTVKNAIAVKLDGDLTGIFTHLTSHEAATTGVHGVGSGTVVSTTGTQTLTNKTLSAPTITGAVNASGATVSGGTLSAPTLTGTIPASGATIQSPTLTNATINASTLSAPTITGTVTASGATITGGTTVNQTIQTPTITGGTHTNMTFVTPALGTPASGNLANCTGYPVSATVVRSARTSDTILGAADSGTLIDITSGSFTQTFTAAATLGSGWFCYYRNSGTGDVALNPNSTENIDGRTSFTMYPGEARLIQCTGTAFFSIVLAPFNKTFTSTDTFIKPPGYFQFGGLLWSGGASGQRNNNASANSIGGAGGGCFPCELPASVVNTTETITIGAGGASVSGVANGNVGGNTSFGSLITVYAGSAFNLGGSIGTTAGLVDTSAGVGQGYTFSCLGGTYNTPQHQIYAGGGTSGNASADSGASIYGGGGGGTVASTGTLYTAGTSLLAGAGGAAAVSGNGTDGTAPGGGGGATQTGTQSGAGARGEARIWGIV